MTKIMVWVLCFPYFTNNFIVHDYLAFKKNNKINNLFIILVMIFFENNNKWFMKTNK
jgi:hypothetical protein